MTACELIKELASKVALYGNFEVRIPMQQDMAGLASYEKSSVTLIPYKSIEGKKYIDLMRISGRTPGA